MARAGGGADTVPCIIRVRLRNGRYSTNRSPAAFSANPCGCSLMPRHPDTPWQFGILYRLDHFEIWHIDDRNIVRYAVGGQKVALVWGECHVPDPLADQQVFLHFVGSAIDHGDPIGGTERDKAGFAVA